MTAMDSINALGRDAFVERFGPVFEDSPWVAAAAWERRPFGDAEELHAAMAAVVKDAPRDRQLDLIRAHPDLAGRAAIAGELTEHSREEQSSAGLDRLTPEEHEALTRANAAYRERFGFPFVVCVREHTKESILAAAQERLHHDPEREIAVALDEIACIARLRLEAIT